MIIVVVSGYFNPLHLGHIRMFREAKELGSKLFVIVNNDKQQLLKKGKIIMNENERFEIVKDLRYVDRVFLSEDNDFSVRKTLLRIRKCYDGKIIFANGGDRKNAQDILEAKVCDDYDIKMVFGVGGDYKENSSTNINKLRGEE